MRILVVGKYPPLQGGVSSQTYWSTRELATRGHEVHVVTNANEVPYGFRQFILDEATAQSSCDPGSGSLEVHHTDALPDNSYIPWANPFGSKLFGLALHTAEERGADVILGWYFEPYGLVAAQVAHCVNRPLILRHAGSDIGRLSKHRNLAMSYRWMLQQAARIITTSGRDVRQRLNSLTNQEGKFIPTTQSRLPAVFSATAEPLEIGKLLEHSRTWYGNYPIERGVTEQVCSINERPIDWRLPTIGVYGKVGAVKGSFDLLKALAHLAKKGIAFNFLAVAGGHNLRLTEFYRAVVNCEPLAERTRLLPMLPPWVVPSFLRRCDIACFLERDFPIVFHGPIVPREIMAVGCCLVVSREIAQKQGFRDSLISFRNCVIVEDPRDTKELCGALESLLTDMDSTKIIAKRGLYLSKGFEGLLAQTNATADLIEALAAEFTD